MFVRPEGAKENIKKNLWIGNIVEIICADAENLVRRLKVHWFDGHADCSSLDRRLAPCYPCYQQNQTSRKRSATRKTISRNMVKVPWIDTIDTDSVVGSIRYFDTKTPSPSNPLKRSHYKHFFSFFFPKFNKVLLRFTSSCFNTQSYSFKQFVSFLFPNIDKDLL